MECKNLCKSYRSESACKSCKKDRIVSEEFYVAKRANSDEEVRGYLVTNRHNGWIEGILNADTDFYELAFIDDSTLRLEEE